MDSLSYKHKQQWYNDVMEFKLEDEPLGIPFEGIVTCPECDWSGIVGDCDIEWDQEGWEYPEYRVLICPECGGVVDI